MTGRSAELLSKYFEHILDALSDGVFISDTSGTTLRINRMYEQLTGLKQQNVQGKNVRTLVEEGVFDRILNPEIVRSGRPATHVQQLKNGKKLVLSGFPVLTRPVSSALWSHLRGISLCLHSFRIRWPGSVALLIKSMINWHIWLTSPGPASLSSPGRP